MEQLTIGSIWQNRKTGKMGEVVAYNKDTNKLQLAGYGNGEGYNIMTPSSLRKNYTFLSKNKEKTTAVIPSKPTTPPVGEPTKDRVLELPTETPQPVPSRQPGRVELPNGKVLPGIRFLLDVAKETEANTCKGSSVIWWMCKTEAGQKLLEQFGAKIVYKPITK